MATYVELSGASSSEYFAGSRLISMEGGSLGLIWQGKQFEQHAPHFFEYFGSRGIRCSKWKLVAVKGKPWELYGMQADRSERNNMAAELPEKVKELSRLQVAWVVRHKEVEGSQQVNASYCR